MTNRTYTQGNKMNKNNFAEEYRIYKGIVERFDAADLADDEEQKDIWIDQMHAFKDEILKKGQSYYQMFERYKKARNCGNEHIDFSENIWDGKVETLINTLRNFGIEHFTFSSGWSSAVKTAWLFKENGCELEDLVMIATDYKEPFSDEYEMVPAYLFKVN